jgi:hypothetical protein
MSLDRKLIWDIDDIFKYDDIYQEHCGDGVQYYDCELLIDFGPFKKGEIVEMIEIESATHGKFEMYLHGKDKSATMVPVWTMLGDI